MLVAQATEKYLVGRASENQKLLVRRLWRRLFVSALQGPRRSLTTLPKLTELREHLRLQLEPSLLEFPLLAFEIASVRGARRTLRSRSGLGRATAANSRNAR